MEGGTRLERREDKQRKRGKWRWNRAMRRKGEEKQRRKLQSIMCKRTGKCSDKENDKICTTESRRELGKRDEREVRTKEKKKYQ